MLCLRSISSWTAGRAQHVPYTRLHLQLMRKNQYEEALFRAEDDRFELDMVIECNASTIQRMQPLAEQLMAMEPEERSNFHIPEGALGPIHYRSVQKIYGEHPHMLPAHYVYSQVKPVAEAALNAAPVASSDPTRASAC